MKALYDFIIEPIGERYNNSIDVDGKSLIVNAEIFNHQYVNRQAKVISIPKAYSTKLKEGDIVLVHHNVFRRWHNMNGDEKNSRGYLNENQYLIREEQIFAYKRNKKWASMKGFCFIKPIKSIDKFSEDKERPLVGIVKYTDGVVDVGDLVGFAPSSEYEFVIDGERLYRVYSKFITIKYEYQGDEEEYNPSWA